MPGDNLAYVDGVVGIQMFEMMRSEFLANPATAEVALLTRRVVTNEFGYWMDSIGNRSPS